MKAWKGAYAMGSRDAALHIRSCSCLERVIFCGTWISFFGVIPRLWGVCLWHPESYQAEMTERGA